MWACDPAITSSIVDSFQVAGPLFVQTLQTIIAAQCALVGDHVWPADATEEVLRDPNYDFIVVGAGSAGAVVANRLSEISDWKVLLIEAGGNPSLTTEIPQLFYSNMNTTADWGYKTEAQDACRSYKNRGCAWPRGKVLGGSSSINAMFYVRGNKKDYDEWEALGNKGWSYEDVLPYFMKSENFVGKLSEEKKKYHGKEGYLNVEDGPPDQLESLILQAAQEIGFKILDEVNAETQMGITRSQSTTKAGVRHSTARAFLSTIKERKNLHVIKDAYVTKILFKPNSKDVQGVLINKNEKDITVNVRKEVIISAGTINTAQLLLLSGIGPKQHLEDMNIDTKADLPVGEGLQDHVFVPSVFSFPGYENVTSLPNIAGEVLSYLLNQNGLLSDTSPNKIIGFMNTSDPYASSPDIQTHHVFMRPKLYNMFDIFRKHEFSEEICNTINKINEDNFILMIFQLLLRPKSKGKIELKSKDPKDHPLIYANYFDDPEDMRVLLQGIRQNSFKMAETNTFKENGIQMHLFDFEACNNNDKTSDKYLECYSRELTFSLYHPTSTARMGPENDNMSVVDPELRVKKVNNLRVIDASVMPFVVRGNTNAPTIMIAEKGADLIKKHWSRHTEL